ncbi:MAG TPA: tRNA pseudouridine(55) synthase TruB [Clostridiales bacterium]|nr:tRNA pseudouridine(55) synthase TruB [Clostridiales bacterium]
MTGILCLNKPKDMTSFSAVAKVRRVLSEKKAGHAGTLDPLATGVLPVLLGGATRFLEFLPTSPKRYIAALRLGCRTDTLDITGTVTEEKEVTIGKKEVEAALSSFRGDVMQVPPMYSALKKDGVRLYDLARKGLEVKREARPVTIFQLSLLTEEQARKQGAEMAPLKEHEFLLDISCSAGTYVRTLIDDLGQVLGTGAVMTQLVRTEVGRFTLAEAVTPAELEAAVKDGRQHDLLCSVPEALQNFRSVTVSGPQSVRFSNGGNLNLDRISALKNSGVNAEQESDYIRVFDPEQHFLGLGECCPAKGTLEVKRIYTER